MDEEDADQSRADPEIHAVPTALNPAKTEGFALLPEDEDEPPPAAVSAANAEAAVAFLRMHKDAADNPEDAARLRAMEYAVGDLLAWYRANGGP